MAQYLVLIYGDEREWEARSEHERRDNHAAHEAFTGAAGSRILGGAELQPTATATSLRAGAEDGPTITDGPFVETKEALGGFYLLEAADLDEVIALASLLQEVSAGGSGVEIRPVVEHG